MHRHLFPVEKMCSVMNVSRSGYYNWLQAKPSMRYHQNTALLVEIRDMFESSHQTYGAPRVTATLNEDREVAISIPRVARMMRASGLAARKPKKFKVTTDSKHNYPIAPNLLERNFEVEQPGQVWVSDITYIRTRQGWLYLTVIMDLYDRKVVG